MMKRKGLALLLLCAMVLLTGCGAQSDRPQLDPSNPVSLTVWHYYNGAQQAAFDELVAEFNATVGKEKGIYVEGYSQGSVSDLEKAVSDAMAGVVGSQRLPDLFSTYADTAYAVQRQGKLTDLTRYFTKEELDQYVTPYTRGRFSKRWGAVSVPGGKSHGDSDAEQDGLAALCRRHGHNRGRIADGGGHYGGGPALL